MNEYDFAVSLLFSELSLPVLPDFSGLAAPHLFASFEPDAAQPPEIIV